MPAGARPPSTRKACEVPLNNIRAQPPRASPGTAEAFLLLPGSEMQRRLAQNQGIQTGPGLV